MDDFDFEVTIFSVYAAGWDEAECADGDAHKNKTILPPAQKLCPDTERRENNNKKT